MRAFPRHDVLRVKLKPVFPYLSNVSSPPPVAPSLPQHYESRGLVDLFHMRLSSLLVDLEDLEDPSMCSLGGQYHRQAVQEDGGKAWAPCHQVWNKCEQGGSGC